MADRAALSGTLLPADPTASLEAATKQYVDGRALPSGGTAGTALVKRTDLDAQTQWSLPVPLGLTPASVLNVRPLLGGGEGTNRFQLQWAVVGDTQVRTTSLSDLSGGWQDNRVFALDATRKRVRMRVEVGAPTTAGSGTARTELRELNLDGTEMATDATVGFHQFHARVQPTRLPPVNPAVVFYQYHNGVTGDRISLRTQLISGQIKLLWRVNGTQAMRVSELYAPDGNGRYPAIELLVEVENNVIRLFTGLGGATPTLSYTVTGALVQTAGVNTWYQKAGVYVQSDAATEGSATEYGEAELWDLWHWHTGWPTPRLWDATPQHAGSHATTGYDPLTPAQIGAAASVHDHTDTISAKNVSYTFTDADDVIIFDTSTAALTATLPTAAGRAGRTFTVKKVGANPLAIATTSSQTVDGVTTETISMSYGFRTVISDGTNWHVIGGKVDPVIANLGSVAAAGTLTINASAATVYRASAAGSTMTVAAPTNPVDADVVNVEILATVATTITIASAILRTGTLTANVGVAAGKRWFGALRHVSGVGWFLLASSAQA